MTANLLAHAGDLFACGIARSGAYNRTLTPFGFQAEERTYWQVGGVGCARSSPAIKQPCSSSFVTVIGGCCHCCQP